MAHRFRHFCDIKSNISNRELNELETKFSYDWHCKEHGDDSIGNFFITKDIIRLNNRMENEMCCSIKHFRIKLDSGQFIFVTFDHGH